MNRNNNNDDDNDDGESVSSVIKMLTLCEDIEKNNPSMTTVDLEGYDLRGYVDDFGVALLNNTYIRSIESLYVNTFWRCVAVDPLFRIGINIAEPFMKFLRESKSLRRLHLTEDSSESFEHRYVEDIEAFVRQIAEALAHNKHIEDVELNVLIAFLPKIFAGFLACRMKSFTAHIWDEAEGMDIILQAFRNNRTLETLTLFHYDDNVIETDNLALALSALTEHPRLRVVTLEVLNGGRQRPLMAALASYVRRAASLEHLQLHHYKFVLEDMSFLLDNYSLPKPTLLHCSLDVPSFMKLASYVQTSTTLKELELAFGYSRHPGYEDLLVGSSLQVLDLSSAYDFNIGNLFTALGESTGNIRLPCLHLGRISPADWRELSLRLPSLIYLRELRVASVPAETITKNFIRRIWENGSLHNVFLTSAEEPSVRLGPSETKVVELICMRNRMLGDFLNQYISLNDGSRLDMKRCCHISLFPSLLHSASEIERTGPNWIFSGLLSIGMSAGAANATKRSASVL